MENIHNILNQLGAAIEAQIGEANLRADTMKAQHEHLINGLAALISQPASNDNAKVDQVVDDTRCCATETSKRAVRGALEDSIFISALTTEWMSAGQLRAQLIALDFKVSEGTIYNRMRKLAVEREDIIDATQKPERWRLRETNKNDRPTRPKKVRQHAAKASRLKIVPTTHDRKHSNTTEILRPVLHHGDCLDVMKTMPDDSVDLILADLPYGTTGLTIDHPLPLDAVFAEYRRILKKPTGNIVLFGSQPFTTDLVNAAPDLFRYSLIWEKDKATEFFHAASKPLKKHEDILVFSYGVNISGKRTKLRATYNPQGALPVRRKSKGASEVAYLKGAVRGLPLGREYNGLTNCPTDILSFAKEAGPKGVKRHPFAKPVALLEYLIRTYSNGGEVVLDNTMGGGSTCVAAMQTERRCIGIEKEREWFDFASERIAMANQQLPAAKIAKPLVPVAKTHNTEIYQGDCLEVMKHMPSGSVDLIVTSPPYNLNFKGRGGMKSTLWPNAKLANGYRSYDDAMPHHEYVEWIRNVMHESWRLLSDDGAIFMNHKPRIQKGKLWTPLDLNLDLPLRQIVIWDRGSGINFTRSFFLPSHEWVLIYAKPKFRLTDGKRPRDVWQINPERNNDHPAPFPVELPMKAIQHTTARTVLDPFMGSGTTGVAALRLGRNFVGIELDEKYAQDAVARINAEALGLAA